MTTDRLDIDTLVARYRGALTKLAQGLDVTASEIGPACQMIREELSDLRAKLAAAEKERDEAIETGHWVGQDEAHDRIADAEARADRLAEALREIAADRSGSFSHPYIARAALADSDAKGKA